MTEPYYSDEFVTLYHGDCLDVLPTLGPVADMVFTSPPYNLGNTTGGGFAHYHKNPSAKPGRWGGGLLAYGYEDHADDMPHAEYVEWQQQVLRACWATLSDAGAIFYNHKPRARSDGLLLPLELNPGLPLRQIIIWARAGGINFAPTHYVSTHEWIMVMAREGWRLKSKAASGAGDVWRVPQAASEHPAPFPIGLPERAIESAAPSLVLDPFAGSGTTLLAAKNAGVRAIGIDKTERYCEMAAARLGSWSHSVAHEGSLFAPSP